MKLKSFFLTLVFFLMTVFSAQAQCAMCRAALETEDGGNKAEGINNGIMYLMVFPYILLIVIGWAVYKVVAKKKHPEKAASQ